MVKRYDFLFLISMLGLIIIGLAYIYSSSIDINGNTVNNEFIKQLFFVIFGVIFFIALHFLPFKYFFEYKTLIYIVGIALLIVTLLFGQIRNGAKSWLGIFGIGIQASEFMKIITIVYLSALLAENSPQLHRNRYMLLYSLPVFIPVILILLQPDLGTALVYIPILLGIFLIYGVSPYKIVYVVFSGIIAVVTLIISFYLNSLKLQSENIELLQTSQYMYYLIILVSVLLFAFIGIYTNYFVKVFRAVSYIISILLSGGLLAYVATYVLKPYQMKRLLVFVNPEVDPLGSGWHILQSVAAIGAGGIRGAGYLQGSQGRLEFLPQKSTDFIFSIISEEMGLLGSALVISLYMILIWRIIVIALKSDDMFSQLFCSGVVVMFFTHFTVNIGMTLGMMPITGIPLLLVSYGGSSLWTSMISLAIVHYIYFNNFYKKATSKIMFNFPK